MTRGWLAGVNGTWKRIFTITNPRLKKYLGKYDELIIVGEDGMLCAMEIIFSYKSSLVSVRGGNMLDIGDYLLVKQTGCRM